MENILEIVSVPVIASAVYWVVNLVKYAVKSNEIFMRFIPLIAGGLGAVLGIICFYALPGAIAADNAIMAIISGGASGLSATGFNQIIKQIKEGAEKKNDDTESNKK